MKQISLKTYKYNNDFVEKNIEYAIQINRWLLIPLGIWPLSSKSNLLEKVINYLIIIICSLLLIFIIVPGSLFTYVKIKNPAIRIKLTGALSFCVMAIIKYYSLVSGRKNIADCIEHLVSDWLRINPLNNREIMLKYAQLGRYGSIICALFMYGGGLFYAGILPHVSASVKNENNVTIRPIAYPSYYIIFDPQESPAYEVVYSLHCCCAFVMHSVTSAACSLAVVFVMHACGQLDILIAWLNELVDENEDRNEVSKRFSDIIEQHTRTLRFIASTENVLCEICLVEVIGCTLNICFLGYYLMLEWQQSDAIGIMTYTILLISFIFNIFLFCYIGELLKAKCSEVGERTFMIDWYRLPEKKALGLTLTIATAQNPITITAGKVFNLSLNGFCTEFERAETIATVTYCVLLVSFTFNIFILCYIGEMLTQQGVKVGLTAYTINWYELSGKKARDLILLLAMSNYPNSITAGKMAELSYNSFCGVLRSAAAYLNLLRTVVL
ncbi:odorant receptor 4 [Microplitis demolitor]|uniref:odorant receptor 4 n=1 Tax=Microplitis demolitor TaxID=69319 RepID=UPI00235B5E3F|nr:odorant receptor 4 [Microplitis demolitor]